MYAGRQIKITAQNTSQSRHCIWAGKAELLEEIRRTGSISQAAKSMNMSYRRAWQLVETMNHSFQSGLVETQKVERMGVGQNSRTWAIVF